jgi:S-disulfanyl-L-cysteine oxidoreductase SoxD
VFSRQSLVTLAGVWVLAFGLRAGAAQQPPVPPAPPVPAAERSTLVGVYTDKQADKGGDAFGIYCTNCHTTASHKGLPFKQQWEGASAWDLFDTIGQTMPKDDPGSLTVEETTDLVAYLLKLNGMPAGQTDLPHDEAALKKIRIELPKSHD